MDRNKLFKINFIIQAVLTTVSQIINIVQQTKKKKDENKDDQEWRAYRDILLYYTSSTVFRVSVLLFNILRIDMGFWNYAPLIEFLVKVAVIYLLTKHLLQLCN